MDPFAPGRDLAIPGVVRNRWPDTLRESLYKPLSFTHFFCKFKRMSGEEYITPLLYRLQWFPWPDAFSSIQAQRRVFSAFSDATSEEDDSFVEYGSTLEGLFMIKRAGLGQSSWSVESISNQLWGLNVTCSVFTLSNDRPGPLLGPGTLADAYSLVQTNEVLVNYVGNCDVSPLSFGELFLYIKSKSEEPSSDSQDCNSYAAIRNEDNVELLDLRGGSWTEIMYGTRFEHSSLQPAPQLRDVPSGITTALTPNVLGKFYCKEQLKKIKPHVSWLSISDGLKFVQDVQSKFYEGGERLLYPSIGFVDSKKRIVPCSKWNTEDCFQFTQPQLHTILVGVEDSALSAFDMSGIIAFVTRFSLAALFLLKHIPIGIYGAIPLSVKEENVIDFEEVMNMITISEDLPVSLATKFLLFPTAMLSKLWNSEPLDTVQAWWVSASLRSILESILSHEPKSPVRNIFPIGSIGSIDSNTTQFMTVSTSCFIPSTIKIDWEKWDSLFLHDGTADMDILMKQLNMELEGNNIPRSHIIVKSLNGQRFPDEPISMTAVNDTSECEKTIEYMPKWAEECLGFVYSLWRHLVVFYPFQIFKLPVSKGRYLQIGTAWKSYPIQNATWSNVQLALKDCIDSPWDMKTSSHIGIAANILDEMGSEQLSNSILSAMCVFGEIQLQGEENCLSDHLQKNVGVKINTSVGNGPSINRRHLRVLEDTHSTLTGNIWIAVSPNQWLGSFKQIDSGVLHGRSLRLSPPLNLVVNGMDVVPFSVVESGPEFYKVGSSALTLEETVKLHLGELKVSIYCGEDVRGVNVPIGSLLLILDKEKITPTEIAGEIGFNLNIVRAKVKGRYAKATFGRMVTNQRALENTIENIQRKRKLEVSSRAIASQIIIHFTLFGNLKISLVSPYKRWVPEECQTTLEQQADGFVLCHQMRISGRTLVNRNENAITKIGLTDTSSLDLHHTSSAISGSSNASGNSEPIQVPSESLHVLNTKVLRYSTGTSPVRSWSSIDLPGILF